MRDTQNKRIMRWLIDNGSITPAQAMEHLGVMRLAARISDLEKAGIKFDRSMVENKNRYGDRVHYMKYSVREV